MFIGTTGDIIVGPGYIEAIYYGNTYCLGYTIGGINMKPETSWSNISRMDTLGYVERRKIGQDFIIRANLIEASLNNLKLAWAGYGLVSSYCFYGGDDVDTQEMELRIIGPGPNCIRRELTLFKVVAYETGEYVYFKEATVIPVIFRCIVDTSRLEGQRVYKICDYEDRRFDLLNGIED